MGGGWRGQEAIAEAIQADASSASAHLLMAQAHPPPSLARRRPAHSRTQPPRVGALLGPGPAETCGAKWSLGAETWAGPLVSI